VRGLGGAAGGEGASRSSRARTCRLHVGVPASLQPPPPPPHSPATGLLPCAAGGALSGKYLAPPGSASASTQYPPGSRFALFGDRYQRFHSPAVMAAAAEYAAIAAAAGLTPAQLAYAFCRSRRYVPSVIVGATTLDQLRENLGAFTPAGELGEEVLAAIDAVHSARRNPSLVD